MRNIKYSIGLSILVFLLFACSTTETIIKDKKIEMEVSAIELDSLPVTHSSIILPDSIKKDIDAIILTLPDSSYVETVKEIQLDNKQPVKKVRIKYYPKKKTFSLYVPPRIIDTTFADTTSHPIINNVTTAEKFGYGTIGVIVFIIVAVGIYFFIKSKL